ncbi:formin-2-like [Pyrgilauda ruficollis]|uniref:formin-2-like n=1 Tax=Pyrgilauda ruficollis TaxID=221976 RepID=UPI001B88435A|nr:formin-2-like [Pyrgilauda ruficollis]
MVQFSKSLSERNKNEVTRAEFSAQLGFQVSRGTTHPRGTPQISSTGGVNAVPATPGNHASLPSPGKLPGGGTRVISLRPLSKASRPTYRTVRPFAPARPGGTPRDEHYGRRGHRALPGGLGRDPPAPPQGPGLPQPLAVPIATVRAAPPPPGRSGAAPPAGPPEHPEAHARAPARAGACAAAAWPGWGGPDPGNGSAHIPGMACPDPEDDSAEIPALPGMAVPRS